MPPSSVTLRQAQDFLAVLAQTTTSPSVKAGFLAGSHYPDGTPVASIAAMQEFGASIRHGAHTTLVPARPFLRPAQAQHQPEWHALFAASLRIALQATARAQQKAVTLQNPTVALQKTGQAMRTNIVNAIQAVQSPPNTAATLRHKHGHKPLVDTAQLLHAVSYQVQA